MNEPSHTFKLVTIWLLVGTCLFLAVQWGLHERAKPQVQSEGGHLVLSRGLDNHYHWPGSVNGQPVEFLLDTGATRTSLPASLAQQLQLTLGDVVTIRTANGPAQARLARVNLSLDHGPRIQQLQVLVVPDLAGQALLGMDVLGRLNLQQQGQQLRISPP